MEVRGEFPRRFYLTPRSVVWDLSEVEAWLRQCRADSDAGRIRKAPSRCSPAQDAPGKRTLRSNLSAKLPVRPV
ncbi:helix-turn-helix transcriptional regulator [Methylobacterium sp. J-090]|uniref:helix-turn-helix transcriptional regulator n=1 Tax=Methylobacterium sp. J-090 TaxID=2836666 RepID=UPI001FBB5E5E|nr:AlpA family phage regulatory protein [Methylobacterium sp. J-090]MCJ2080784.1 AlpA family transcriptional regulator [Methylobacterium sp. J-090]